MSNEMTFKAQETCLRMEPKMSRLMSLFCRDNIKVEIRCKGGSFTNPTTKRIRVGLDADDIKLDTELQELRIKFLSYHEGSHRRWTSMAEAEVLESEASSLCESCIPDKEAREMFVHYILNILEDGRIENALVNEYPGLRELRDWNRLEDYENYPISEGSGLLQDATNDLLSLSTCGLHQKGFEEKYPEDSSFLKDMESMLPNIALYVSSKTMLGGKEAYLNILKKFLSMFGSEIEDKYFRPKVMDIPEELKEKIREELKRQKELGNTRRNAEEAANNDSVVSFLTDDENDKGKDEAEKKTAKKPKIIIDLRTKRPEKDSPESEDPSGSSGSPSDNTSKSEDSEMNNTDSNPESRSDNTSSGNTTPNDKGKDGERGEVESEENSNASSDSPDSSVDEKNGGSKGSSTPNEEKSTEDENMSSQGDLENLDDDISDDDISDDDIFDNASDDDIFDNASDDDIFDNASDDDILDDASDKEGIETGDFSDRDISEPTGDMKGSFGGSFGEAGESSEKNMEERYGKSASDEAVNEYLEKMRETLSKDLVESEVNEKTKEKKRELREAMKTSDLAEVTEEDLKTLSEQAGIACRGNKEVNDSKLYTNTPCSSSVRIRGGRSRRKIENFLKNQESERINGRYEGVFDVSSSSKFIIGRSDVFAREDVPNETSACCLVIKDDSGSMGGIKEAYAIEALSEIEEMLKGIIPLKLSTFSSLHGGNFCKVIKDWTDNDLNKSYTASHSRFNSPSGGTNDDFAILNGAAQLLKRPEKDKLLIILSDGQSSYPDQVKKVVKWARKNHIFVISVFIGNNEYEIKGMEKIFSDMYEKYYTLCMPDKLGNVLVNYIKRFIKNI